MKLVEEFVRLKNFYRDNQFKEILAHELGIYFLKMRSVSRKGLLDELGQKVKIDLPKISSGGDKLFEFLFCKNISIEMNLSRKFMSEREQSDEITRIIFIRNSTN